MNSAIKIVILAVAVVVIAVAVFLLSQNGNKPGANTAQNSSSPLFNSTVYAQSAYLISDNASLSPEGQIATANFNLTVKQLSNGSTEYTMTFFGTNAVYNATVAPGNHLYFIDTSLGDDGPGADGSGGDDGYAIVNSTGYVVELKPLPGA